MGFKFDIADGHSKEFVNNMELMNQYKDKGIEAQHLVVLMDIARSLDLLSQQGIS